MANFFATITESWFWKYFLSHFGWVDWMLTAFILVGIMFGLKQGVTVEVPRLLETLISLYVTLEYYSFFAEWLARETPWPESYARVFTFAALGFLSWFSLRLLFEIMGRVVHLEVAAPFQMVGGVLLGGLRYFLFFSLISYLLILSPLDFIHRSYQVQSWSGQTLAQIAPKIHDFVKGLWSTRGAV